MILFDNHILGEISEISFLRLWSLNEGNWLQQFRWFQARTFRPVSKSWRKRYNHTMRMQNQAKLPTGAHYGHESRKYSAPEGVRSGHMSWPFTYFGVRAPVPPFLLSGPLTFRKSQYKTDFDEKLNTQIFSKISIHNFQRTQYITNLEENSIHQFEKTQYSVRVLRLCWYDDLTSWLDINLTSYNLSNDLKRGQRRGWQVNLSSHLSSWLVCQMELVTNEKIGYRQRKIENH